MKALLWQLLKFVLCSLSELEFVPFCLEYPVLQELASVVNQSDNCCAALHGLLWESAEAIQHNPLHETLSKEAWTQNLRVRDSSNAVPRSVKD